jgi:predicted dithiol-disulfide oxidoreductase (DUF899 family)
MNGPKTVLRTEWLAARKALLPKEEEATRQERVHRGGRIRVKSCNDRNRDCT